MNPRQKIDFLRAASTGDLNKVKSMASSYEDLQQVKDRIGRTALVLASRKGYLKIVELLLGRIDVKSKDYFGNTSLQYACCFYNVDVARLLLVHGADSNVANSDGWTVLMNVACCGYIDTARLLLDFGADSNAVDHSGRTVLMWGSEHVDMVRLLLRRDADATATDMYGCTVLMHCIFNSHESVWLLLEAETRTRDCRELSALNYAVRSGRLDVALALCSYATEFDRRDCFDNGRLEFIVAFE